MSLRRWLIVGAVLSLGVVAVLIAALQDFDLSGFDQTDLTFKTDGQTLSGTLILPNDVTDPPIAVIVHGDGPQDRYSADGYLPLFNALLDAGIGVFSWDKPGIGASMGSWLDQSMPDRTMEAVAALQTIQALPNISADNVGFLGFSQAGWVVPAATHRVIPAFTVLIGPAVSWQDQGAFFTSRRMAAEGATQTAISAALAANAQRDAVIFAPDYTPTPDDLGGMTPARFAFVARNHTADATSDIARMTGPVLAVWGADDLNVDAVTDAATYAAMLPIPDQQTTLLVPNATHGLLRAALYNYQLPDQWPAYAQAAFVVSGRHAFAPGALDAVTTWINAQRD